MRHVGKHDSTMTPLAERLREIPLTESEREAAGLHLARGERFADIVLAGAQAVQRLTMSAKRSIAIAARHLRIAFRRAARRGKSLARRHGTSSVHPN